MKDEYCVYYGNKAKPATWNSSPSSRDAMNSKFITTANSFSGSQRLAPAIVGIVQVKKSQVKRYVRNN
jgi:hypothetical protein